MQSFRLEVDFTWREWTVNGALRLRHVKYIPFLISFGAISNDFVGGFGRVD